MNNLNRRNWIKGIASAGAGALVVRPAEILKLLPKEDDWSAHDEAIRLSSNENPYSPSVKMKEAISRAHSELCRYPNRHFSTLEKIIAERQDVLPENVVLTSGSREGLNVSGLVFGMNGREILTCMPTYKSLMAYAERFGAYINIAPLTDDLSFDLDAMDKRIHANTGLVFICNPNNPTGTLLDAGELRNFCISASKRTMVFVDEVYFDYIEQEGYPSMASLIKEGHNIIISRTFSKIYGLAGVRIGYLIAREDVAHRLRQRLMSGTNIMGLRLAMAGLEDDEFYNFCISKNKEGKQMIYDTLDGMGMEYKKSHTNFVFFHTGRPVDKVIKDFRKYNIVVGRPFPPLTDWCRISTGKIEDVEAFTGALKKVFA